MLKKVIDYKVVSGQSTYEIETNVKHFLSLDWCLVGNVSVTFNEKQYQYTYVQTMIKYE